MVLYTNHVQYVTRESLYRSISLVSSNRKFPLFQHQIKAQCSVYFNILGVIIVYSKAIDTRFLKGRRLIKSCIGAYYDDSCSLARGNRYRHEYLNAFYAVHTFVAPGYPANWNSFVYQRPSVMISIETFLEYDCHGSISNRVITYQILCIVYGHYRFWLMLC